MDSPYAREAELSGHSLRSSNRSTFLQSNDGADGSPSTFLRLTTTPRLSTNITDSAKRTPLQPRNIRVEQANESLAALQRFRVESPELSSPSLILSEEDPGVEACSTLFRDFLQIFRSYRGQHEIFELVKSYEKRCSEVVEVLQKLVQHDPYASLQFSKTSQLLHLMTAERNTWRLVSTLTRDRLETAEDDIELDEGQHMSDRQLIENLYKSDANIRQTQLVIDWLERNAADDLLSKNPHKMEYFASTSAAWEHTLHRNLTQHGTAKLDPDATLRNPPTILHETDKEDEERLYKCMFTYIRAGQLPEAQRVANKFGVPWLSAALEGWKLHSDPNLEAEDEQLLAPVEGNPNRSLWLSAVWTAVTKAKMSQWERAVYAAFSGQLQPLLAVSTNWHDHLWAYLRVLTDVRIEHCLREHRPALIDLPMAFWENNFNLQDIFTEIESNKKLQPESKQPHNSVQKQVILNDMEGLISAAEEWTTSATPHHLRFLAHLVLFLRSAGVILREEGCTRVLRSYVQCLIREKLSTLVAPYTATLPGSIQVEVYSHFLEGVTLLSERQRCLQWAEEAELDVPLIAKTVVENIRRKETDDYSMDIELAPETTEEDLKKIEAIDWLVFDPAQRSEAIRQANALMRSFIACNKMEAARQVFTKIPPDSLNVVFCHWKELTGSTELTNRDQNTTKEYLCFQSYLLALDAFNSWYEYYHHGRPKEPQKPAQGPNVRYTELLAYEHCLKQYQSDMERWKQSLDSQTKTTKDKLYNVLLFIKGGWMVDAEDILGQEDEPGRKDQMALLRRLCLPKVTLLLHDVLTSSGRLQEALRLADIVASEHHQLYKEFSHQDLRTLLVKLRETSLELLDQNLDALGFPPS